MIHLPKVSRGGTAAAPSLLHVAGVGHCRALVPSRGEHAYRHIALLMRCGELRAGDALPPERTLGRIFDIARGSLRLALERLEHDGTVRIRHGKRTLVIGQPLSPSKPFGTVARDCLKTRHVMENVRRLSSSPIVAPGTAPCRVGPAAARRLGLLVDLQHAAQDLAQFVIVDRQFYAELEMCFDARQFPDALQLADALTHSALRDALEAQDARRNVVEQHRTIVSAVERQDVSAAIAVLCEQLEMRSASRLACQAEGGCEL